MRSSLLGAVRPALSRSLPQSRNITIPAPELSKDGGVTRFIVRTDNVIDNAATALRLVRAVEKELGPVVAVDLPKDPDMRRGFKFMSVTTLKPAPLAETLHGELPAGKVEKGKDTGGVSLADVMAALGAASPSFTSTRTVPSLKYRIDRRDAPPRRRIRRTPPALTPAEKTEDSEIVGALRRFQGGFFGGFAGVADTHAERELPAEPAPPVVHKPKTMPPKAAPGEKKTFEEIIAASRAVAAAAAAAPQEQPAAAEPALPEVELVQEEKADPAELRRVKLQQRAIEIARRNAALAAEAETAKAAPAPAQPEAQPEAAEKKQETKEKKGWFPF